MNRELLESLEDIILSIILIAGILLIIKHWM